MRSVWFELFDAEKVILFLTDGEPTDPEGTVMETLRQGNHQLDNQVILFTFGLGQSESV